MNELRIGYFADGPWAHRALEALLADRRVAVVFICGRYDTSDDVLKAMAADAKIPFLRFKNVNHSDVLNELDTYHADLYVSMSFNQIFKAPIIAQPARGIINCHAGQLPFYRGRNVLNWVLINDEKTFGITVHYVDEGIDTGDIIVQESYAIDDSDDYASLLDIAYRACAPLLMTAIDQLLAGAVNPVKQSTIHPIGFYCARRRAGDEIINWQQSSRAIFCFVRALCSPGLYAQTELNGHMVIVRRVALIDQAPNYKGICGQVVNKEGGALVVKTMDTTLAITDYTSTVDIRVGDRFTMTDC